MNGRGRPLKGVSLQNDGGQAKRKNTSLQEKTCRFFFDTLLVSRLGVDLLFILFRARYFCL
jgi:hypothetical protein